MSHAKKMARTVNRSPTVMAELKGMSLGRFGREGLLMDYNRQSMVEGAGELKEE